MTEELQEADREAVLAAERERSARIRFGIVSATNTVGLDAEGQACLDVAYGIAKIAWMDAYADLQKALLRAYEARHDLSPTHSFVNPFKPGAGL